jgi:hypothetical protein
MEARVNKIGALRTTRNDNGTPLKSETLETDAERLFGLVISAISSMTGARIMNRG